MDTKKEIMDHNMNNNIIELFSTGDGDIQLKVNLTDDTVWLTQKQTAELFAKARNSIAEHIDNVFLEEELNEKVVCRDFRYTTLKENCNEIK